MRTTYRLLVVLGVLTLALGITQLTVYQSVDRWVQDKLHLLSARDIHFDDAVIIDINDESIFILESQLGAWPYHRDVFAILVDYLNRVGSSTISFDIIFSESREGDGAFARALQASSHAILASRAIDFNINHTEDYFSIREAHSAAIQTVDTLMVHNWTDFMLPQSQLLGTDPDKVTTGVITVPADADGVLRRMPLLHAANGIALPSMPLATLMRSEPARELYDLGNGNIAYGRHRWVVDEEGFFHLRYPKNADAVTVLPFYKVLLAALNAPGYETIKQQLLDRVVFIGSSASSLGDYTFTPFHGRTAGLGILTIAYLNLSHDMLIKPSVVSWDVVLLLLGVAIPFFVIYRYKYNTVQIILAAAASGMSSVWLGYLLMLYANQMSSLTFVLMLNVLMLVGYVMVRYNHIDSERRRLYYEKMAADEANELKSKFLSHVSHELRTPLSAIVGFSQTILDDDHIHVSERKRRVGIIRQNSQLLLELINNLLDKAKIQSGKLTIDCVRTPIHSLLDNIIDSLKPLAANKDLALDRRIADGVPEHLLIDDLRLRQIITNLIGNAIKFTSQGRVTLEVEWKDGWLCVKVIDTGPGIEEASLSKVFEAFEQAGANVTRSYGGTGLGLNISAELAQLMGGGISVDSQLGVGTTFTLRIPAEISAPPTAENSAQTCMQKPLLPDVKVRRKVLVADDTVFIRELVSMLLTQLGCDVLLAENGEQAVSMTMEEVPDLVLMDFEMPLMSGREAAALLRQSGYTGPIIAMTAYSGSTSELHRFGFDQQISKPIDPEQLRSLIGG